jgi:hypothetical protein
MAYKILGIAVWRVARWYMRRRYSSMGRKAAMGGLGVAAMAGALAAAASRQRSS